MKFTVVKTIKISQNAHVYNLIFFFKKIVSYVPLVLKTHRISLSHLIVYLVALNAWLLNLSAFRNPGRQETNCYYTSVKVNDKNWLNGLSSDAFPTLAQTTKGQIMKLCSENFQ